MIQNINQEHYFVLSDGKQLKSLQELIHALKTIDKQVYEHHVTPEKNDFSNWIHYVFKAPLLAEQIQKYTYHERKDMVAAIKEYLDRCVIFVINSGSSSIKFQLIELTAKKILIKGMIDAIGLPHCAIKTVVHGQEQLAAINIANHDEGINYIMNLLLRQHIIGDVSDIAAIGHRVVHGGEKHIKPTIITEQVIADLEELCAIAPLHNPANIAGIRACLGLGRPQVAIFDTAFHASIPKEKYLYGIPYEFYEQYKIRKYGFHGTSHKYVYTQVIKTLPKLKKGKIIICHLGNGCSITAIKNGKSFNNTMGFSPTDGLIMGTRTGHLDPTISIHLGTLLKLNYEQLGKVLNKQSGLLGISGTSDMRLLWKHRSDSKHRLAMDMFADRVTHYIGAYIAELNGVDAIVFTGGIGENAWYIRKKVLEQLKFAGVSIDEKKNQRNEQTISSGKSKVRCLVIPTNEELQIAQETKAVLKL